MSLKLEVGEFYLSASGEIVFIEKIDNNGLFIDTDENYYKENGTLSMFECTEFDLIAHIPKELHKMICELVNNYHTNNEVKVSAYFNSLWQHHSNTYKDER